MNVGLRTGNAAPQLVDVIDWVDEPGVLAIRYPMQDREIQNGGQLTVHEGQVAMFHNEGRCGPGQHTLITQNLPLLTAIMNCDKSFKSPFKTTSVSSPSASRQV